MRPYPEEVLRTLQTGLGAHFLPEISSRYAQAQFAFAQLLFMVVQRDYDSAAQDLIDGSRELREILGEAHAALAAVDRDDARAARERLSALPAPAESVRLSALRREHEGLRQAVSDLAPLVEPAADVEELAPLRPVRERLYAHLKADATRRSVPILSA